MFVLSVCMMEGRTHLFLHFSYFRFFFIFIRKLPHQLSLRHAEDWELKNKDDGNICPQSVFVVLCLCYSLIKCTCCCWLWFCLANQRGLISWTIFSRSGFMTLALADQNNAHNGWFWKLFWPKRRKENSAIKVTEGWRQLQLVCVSFRKF